jgi:TolA-binding protein
MEGIMKKVTFAIIILFVLFALSETILAGTDTEYEKALRYYYLGKYKEAIRLFKDYVEKGPDPSAYYYTGYALYKIGKYGEADKYFKMAYLIDPMFSPIKKYPKTTIKEINTPARKKIFSEIPSVAESREKRMLFLALLYIIASHKG